MSKPEKTIDIDNEETYLEVAKNALIFALIFIVITIALWGYVYWILLERGMTI